MFENLELMRTVERFGGRVDSPLDLYVERRAASTARFRNGAYYTCELNRRQASLVPEEHPRTVYLREDRAGEKVVEFLSTHVFGPDRIEALRKSLAEVGPDAEKAHDEVASCV